MKKTGYEIITENIIEMLENGEIPWEKPWISVRGNGAYSGSTGKPYSILNQLMLKKPGEYLTFNEAKKRGGHVKKGAKASTVILSKWKIIEEEDDNGETKKIPIRLFRYFNVFHIDQCEGVKPRKEEKLFNENEPIQACEQLIKEYADRSGVRYIIEKSNRAYYRPSEDEIHLPVIEQFAQVEEFYSTAFHESVHSTGHKNRLNRIAENTVFGDEVYSKEELVAELGSAILCNELGIETVHTKRNNAAYIQAWLKALKSDKRMLISATEKAAKAVKLILNIEDEQESAEADS